MKIRGLKTALHMVVAATVTLTSLTLTPMVAEATQATTVATNPAMVCSGATCTVTFPYVAGKYYEYTPIAGETISLKVVGGAGGNGGNDSHAGGAGATGSQVTLSTAPASGTVLKIYPGSAGVYGLTMVAGYGGGAGGISTYGDYNGGAGAPSCNNNGSGAGGGGGAASIVQIGSSTPLVIAGGGGGGGGGGNYGNGTAGTGPSSNGLTYGSNGGGGGACDGGSGAGGGGGLTGGVGGGVGWASYNSYGEFFGYGGATGSSGGPTGSTVVNNVAGQTGNGYVTVTYVNRTPSITTTSAYQNGTNVAFDVEFPEAVSGLTLSDFVIDQSSTATCSSFTNLVSVSPTKYTVVASGCSEGALTVKLPSGSTTEVVGGEANFESVSASTVIDRTAANVSITAPTSPSNSSTLNFSVVTNEALKAGVLTASDFTVTGAGCTVGAITAPTSPAVSPYNVAVTGCATNQTVGLTLKSGMVEDLAGNLSPASALVSSNVVTDYQAPTGTWVTPTLATTNLPTLYYTMLMTEPIAPSSLAAADFVNAGTATGCVFVPTTAGQTITLAVTGCSAGTVIPRLAANALTDLAGNTGPAAAITGPTVTRDVTVPTATIVASPTTTPSMATVLNYNVTFSKAVSGLTASDFTNSGTATGCIFVPTLSNDGLTATLSASFCTDGTVIPTLAAGSVVDAAGNAAPAAATNGTAITLDRTPLAFTAATTTAAALTNATSIVYNLTTTEAWANLSAADFVNAGTATGCTFVLTGLTATTLTATVTGCSTTGTLKPVVTALSLTDVVGNLSPVAAYALPELTLDRVAPVVVAGDFPDENVATFAPLTYTYTFSEPIADASLTAADFSNVGAATTATGCVYAPVVAANHLSATVTVTGCSEGNIKLRLAANALTDLAGNTGPAAAIDSPVTALINTAPRVTFTTNPPALTNQLTLSYTATFSENVTGVTANAFVVSGTATGCVLTSSVTNPASAVNATNLTVTCTSEGTVIVTAKANVLTDSSSASRPGPEARVEAATVTIDRTAPTATFTPIGAVTSPTGAPSQTFKLNFSEPINPATLVASDFTNAGAATAATGCVFTPTVAADGRSADVVVTGCGSGNLVPQLSGSALQDVAGNNSPSSVVKLADAATPGTPINIVMDRTAPTATLVGNPATTPTAGPSLAYNLTFNEAVTGLTASDFTNAGTATGCVFTPASATPAAATAVAVTVTGCTSGTVVLTLAAGGVLDTVGMPGPTTNLVATAITLDVTSPAVTEMATTFAGALPTATNVTFTTKFAEATSGIVGSDFENAGTATGCVFTPAAATVAANTNLTVTVTGCSEGTLIPRLKAASVTDAVGNAGPVLASTLTSTIVIDSSAPTATITTALPALTNATTLTYTVTFSDSVTGIAAADFSNSAPAGAALGCVFTPSATSGTTITVAVTSCSAGNVVLKLVANSVANLSAQNGPVAFVEAPAIAIERTAPTAMVIAPASPNNSLSQVFQLTFGEAVTGLTLDDLAITGVTGCTSALTNVTSTSATLTLNSCGTGTLRVALKPSSITDAYGNAGPISEVVTEVGIDRTAPVFSITAPATPTNSATLSYSVVVNEPIAAGTLNASDFVVTGAGCVPGTLTAPVSGFSPYTLTVTGCADTATVGVSLPARAAADLAANLGPITTVSAATVSVDRVKPDSTITTSYPAVTNSTIISYTIVTSESIDPATVVAADFTNVASAPAATGCVFSPYVVGKTITVTISGCSEGNVVLKQLADSMTDTGANTGPALFETGPVVKIDRTAPTETLVAAVTTSPSSAATFTYNATFTDSGSGLIGLTGADFTNTGTATGCVFTPATSTPTTATTVAVVVSGCSEGTLIVNQVAGAVSDLGGNVGPAAAIVMPAITIDRTAATATITTAVVSPTSATSIAYTVTFSEPITGLAAGDFTNGASGTAATGCVFTPSAASGTTITLTVTGCSTTGNLKPVLALGAVNDGALTASPVAAVNGPELTLDRVVPTVTAGTVPEPSLTTAPVSLVYTYTFGEPIQDSSLTAADFSNVGASVASTNCVITPVVAADHLSASVTVTNCSDGNVKLRLAANAVTDVAGNTGPAALIDSSVTTAINTAPRVTFTTAPGAYANGATLNYVATFSESVIGVTASDFALSGTATDCVLTLATPANGTTATTSATFSITGCTPGTVIVTMPAASVTEAATSVTGPLADLVSTTTIDRSVATATIAGVGVITSPTGAASMTFRLTFNEAIQASSLTASDITNGAAAFVDPLTGVVTPAAVCTYGTPVLAGDGLTATVEVTNCSSGLLNPKLGSGQVTDLAGNPAPATTVKLATALLVDRTVPTATLVPVVTTSPTAATSLAYTATFSEGVTGVTAADFTNTGTATGCVFGVTGSGTTYTVTATSCSTSGTVIVNLASASATDSVANAGPAAAVVASTITLDRVGPTATLSTTSGGGITLGTNVTYTVTFNEPIVPGTLTAADFVNTGTAAGCVFGAPVVAGNGLSATVLVSSCARPDDVTMGVSLVPSLKANAVTDVLGNAGPAADAAIAAPVTIAGSANPTGTIAAPASPTNSATQVFTVTMTDYVYGVTGLAFTNALTGQAGAATGCSFVASAASAQVFTVTASNCSSGNIALKFGPHVSGTASSAVYNAANVWTAVGSQFVSPTVVIDKVLATATITSVYGSEASAPKFVVDFSEPISGLTLSDFTVQGDPACVPTITSQTATRAELSLANCVAGSVIRLTLANGSVADGAGNASPVTVVSSEPVTVLLAEQAPLVATTNMSSILFGATTQVKVSVPAAGVTGGGSGTGAVTYATSTTSVCTVNATTGVITQVAIGDCMVSATRAGNATYLAATSAEVKVRLTRQPQLPLVGVGTPSSLVYNPTAQPQTVLISTTGGSGNGAVSAAIDELSTDVCSIDGMTVTIHIPGNCVVDVTKSGGNVYEDATGSVTITMTKADQAAIVPVASAASAPWDAENPIVISVPQSGPGAGSGQGAVTFSSTTPDVCGVDGVTGTLIAVDPVVLGTCSVIAAKAGDDYFNEKYSAPISVTLTKGNQDDLVIVSDDTEGSVSDSIQVEVSDQDGEAGSGTGVVTFAVTPESAQFCSVNANTGLVTGKKPGACVVIATKAADDIYLQKVSPSLSVQIVKSPQEILFVPIAQLFNGGKAVVAGTGKPFAITAVTTATGITPSFVSQTPAVCTVVGNMATPKSLGVCRITASAAGNDSYLAATDVTKEIAILEKPIPQVLDHTPQARVSLVLPDATPAATLKSVFTVGSPALNNFVTPILAIDKSSVKNCSVVNGKLHGLGAGACVYTLAAPAVGAFLALAPTKFTTTFFAGDNTTTQVYPTAVAGGSHSIAMSGTLLPLSGASSASQPVTYTTVDPNICWADGDGNMHLAGAGTCTFSAVSGGGAYTVSTSAPLSFTISKASQVATYVAPGEVIPGSSPVKRAAEATDNPAGFPLQYTLSSGLTPVYTSLDPDNCLVDPDGTVTWQADIRSTPAKNTCRITVSEPGNSAYNALPLETLTVTARPSTTPYVPGTPVSEKPVFTSLPRTGGKASAGPDTFAVTVKNNTVEVQPFSRGLYIGPITATVTVPYKVMVNGVLVDKSQTCTTKFGVQKAIAANKSPMAMKQFTNSMKCALNKDAFAWFKAGNSLDITAKVLRTRLYPTTMKPFDPKLKRPIAPKQVTWHLMVG